jgi:N-acetylglucosamine-6-phosphate deacetylase
MQEVQFPGFFDLQVNGFAGVDFNDPALGPEQVGHAIAAMRATGVTRFLAALISAPLDSFSRCARTLASCSDPGLAGVHLEGPYLSREARGAHPAEHLAPASVEDFQRRQDAAGGRIRLVTLAPEIPGALGLIDYLVSSGVRVAIGHSAAHPSVIGEAVRAGATLSTHLGNGCPAVLPRHPNLLWEQLAADGLVAGLIVDGHHLSASVVKLMVRAKSLARTVLVTDATAAAGQPPGRYRLGQMPVELSPSGRVTLAGTDVLAGSALTLDAAVASTTRFTGHPLADVLPLATTQPARSVGLETAGRVVGRWDAGASVLSILRVDP